MSWKTSIRVGRCHAMLMITACLLTLDACDSASSREGDGHAPSALGSVATPSSEAGAESAESVSLSLSEHFATATVDRTLGSLSFEGPSRYRSSGWNPSQDDSGRHYAWSYGRDSVIDLAVAEPAPRMLRIELSPLPKNERIPRQRLRVLWNAHVLAERPREWRRQTLEFDVPKNFQRRGPNRIELLPAYWVSPLAAGVLLDPRPLGVQVWNLELIPGPGNPLSPEPTVIEKRAIVEQSPGWTVTYAFRLPQRARLRGTLKLRDTSQYRNGKKPRGRVYVAALLRGGLEKTLLEVDSSELAGGVQRELDIDLGEFAGQSAMITLGLSATGTQESLAASPAARVQWRNARIEGTQTATVRSPRVGSARGKNVLIVLFDALRADYTEPYGGDSAATPHMQLLATKGTTFANARSNATWTRPSVASLMTSLYPQTHQVVSGDRKLPSSLSYFPEILHEGGYATVAISNNGHVSKATGFARGFDAFHEYFRQRESIRRSVSDPAAQADRVWDDFVEPFVKQHRDRPFFVYLHEIDPHSPYEPPEPYDRIDDFEYRSNLSLGGGSVDRELRFWSTVNVRMPWLEPPDARFIRSRYAGEVAFMDQYLGRILRRLEQSGLAGQTIVVFMADHGEALGEHDYWGHQQPIYEEILRVPLIMLAPGILPAGKRVSDPVQLVDLAPTLLQLLGIDPPTPWQGHSLLAALDDRTVHEPRFLYAKSDHSAQDTFSILDSVTLGRWKLVRKRWTLNDLDYDDMRLYDLKADPGEQNNVWPSEPVVGRVLLQALDEEQRRDAERGIEAVGIDEADPGLIQNLRALGYVD